MWFYILAVSALIALYFWLKSFFTIWEKQNVPNPPTNLLFGNMTDAILFKKNLGQIYRDVYNEYQHLQYVGFYRNRTPAIILREPELIKSVLVKDFQSFHDNDFNLDEKIDPIFGRNPFNVKGEKWKHVRNQVTPCFTSGKMKAIFPVMQSVAKKFVDYIEREHKSGGLDAKEICAKFTTENVINCAYGIEANCFDNPNSEFRVMGEKIFDTSFVGGIVFLVSFAFPSLSKYLNIKVVPTEVANFFRNLIKEIVDYRSANSIQRNDFLQNLLDISKKDPKFDHEDLTAHSVGLFIDGFETSSVALSFLMYDLAANLEAQQKLRVEVDEVVASGDVTYEKILGLPYLEAALMESIRLHPPAPFMMRQCTKPFKFPTPDGSRDKEVNIPVGTVLMVPLLGLHLDKKYFEEPNQFRPERFLDANKQEIPKYAFLPFGEGPRICLGMRFGVAQVKAAIFHVIANFEMRVNKKTIQPLEIDPNYFLLKAKGGLWIDFYKRK